MANENGGWGEPGFHYYYVSEALADSVKSQRIEGNQCHIHIVKNGTTSYQMAGSAMTWLGKASLNNIAGIFIVGHGGPGEVFVGEKLHAKNIAPLAGWIYYRLHPSARIRILGCASGADSLLPLGKYEFGQMSESKHNRPGYDLLFALARVSKRISEGALNGQAKVPLGLKMGCRRVYPNGRDEHFWGMGMQDPPID